MVKGGRRDKRRLEQFLSQRKKADELEAAKTQKKPKKTYDPAKNLQALKDLDARRQQLLNEELM